MTERCLMLSELLTNESIQKEVNMNDMFIRRLLEVTLQPGNPRKVKHSSEVLRFLLEKRTIGHGSIGGGLLPVLLQRSDWVRIFS